MIYLGTQLQAKENYLQRVVCWVNKKLRGGYSSDNTSVYKCLIDNCSVCKRPFKKLPNIPNKFINFILPELEEIITVTPDRMLILERDLTDKWVFISLGSEQEFKDLCKTLFEEKGYSGWFIKYSINYDLAEWLDQHTCTYCNRQYIFTARKKDGEKGITCQFDHWFDKATHSLLALSFYNLIPSCSVCNSSVKTSKTFNTDNHLHPYLNEDISDRYKFSYRLNSVSNPEINFRNESKLDKKTRLTLKDLETKLIYSKHSSKELQDLIDLRYKYSENYLKILLEQTFGDLSIPNNEKYRIIFGIELDEKDYHKRPFSKFKKDIIEELLNLRD